MVKKKKQRRVREKRGDIETGKNDFAISNWRKQGVSRKYLQFTFLKLKQQQL